MPDPSPTRSDPDAEISALVAISRRRRLTGEEAAHLASLAIDCTREEDAIPALQPLVQQGGGEPVLYHWLGLLHRALGAHEQAMRTLDRGAALAPRDAGIAHLRARVAWEAGLPSVDLFGQAVALAPTDGDVLLGRLSARLAAGEQERALAELDALLAQHPGWYAGHEAMVQLRWMMGDRNGFTRSIAQALATAPRDANLWLLLLRALTHARMFDVLLAAVTRARQAIGADPRLTVLEAAAASGLGEIGQADRLFASIADPRDATGVVHHVRHLLRAGRPDRAAALGESSVDGPDADHVWPYLATAWRLLDDPRYEWLLGDPALVGVYDIADACGDLAALADRLRGLHRATHQHLDQSVRGGTQTDGPLFSMIDPAIRRLRRAVEQQVAGHIRNLSPPDPRHPVLRHRRDRPVRFSGSWSVRLSGRGHHASHVHPAGWFSSAFYVSLPSGAEAGPPPAGWLALGAPPQELGLGLAPVARIEPRPGRLVLFPSILWHGTEPFGAGERLTAACDVARPAGML